ncbi:MAG: hypothetical protein EP338_00095 [Bacteroidetes bacterium]|nr:MAG: hypothetical protein EP338_00095 [Bacteroidota bacterium]
MIKYAFAVLLFFGSLSVIAQGKVEYIPNAGIEMLIKKKGEIEPPATSPQTVGYRLQLFFDSDKGLVDDARARFVALHPKVDTYVTYTAPNYFLKVGDFRSQLDAERIQSTVEAQFPTSFIVKEMINLPRIDQE